MLLPDGCTNKQEIRLVGVKRFESREWVEVLYDKQYVVSRILTDVLRPLNLVTLQRLLNLMIDVWTQANEVSNHVTIEADRIRLLLSGDSSPTKSTTKAIDLKMLKARRLHGKDAYFVDELLTELRNQDFLVMDNHQELASTVNGK